MTTKSTGGDNDDCNDNHDSNFDGNFDDTDEIMTKKHTSIKSPQNMTISIRPASSLITHQIPQSGSCGGL